MVDLINPHTRTVVQAAPDSVERLVAAGFKPVAPPAPPKPEKRRSKKSD